MSTQTTLAMEAEERGLPVIPREYHAPESTMGQVPAECARGFEVTRVPDTPTGRAEAKAVGLYLVIAGDRNPDNPAELLIRNDAAFGRTADGILTYKGDLVAVWRTEFAEAYRQEAARKARAASEGVRITRRPLDEGMTVPAELAALVGG